MIFLTSFFMSHGSYARKILKKNLLKEVFYILKNSFRIILRLPFWIFPGLNLLALLTFDSFSSSHFNFWKLSSANLEILLLDSKDNLQLSWYSHLIQLSPRSFLLLFFIDLRLEGLIHMSLGTFSQIKLFHFRVKLLKNFIILIDGRKTKLEIFWLFKFSSDFYVEFKFQKSEMDWQ